MLNVVQGMLSKLILVYSITFYLCCSCRDLNIEKLVSCG